MAELEARKLKYPNTDTEEAFANENFNWGLVAFQLWGIRHWSWWLLWVSRLLGHWPHAFLNILVLNCWQYTWWSESTIFNLVKKKGDLCEGWQTERYKCLLLLFSQTTTKEPRCIWIWKLAHVSTNGMNVNETTRIQEKMVSTQCFRIPLFFLFYVHIMPSSSLIFCLLIPMWFWF